MRPLRAFRIPFLAGAGGDPPIPPNYFRGYDSSSPNRVYSDAYITPAVADGAIHVIADDYTADGSNGALQATGANQPIWKAAVQNGLNVARFDGSNDFLAAEVDGTAFTHLVMGLVMRINSVASASGPAYFSWGDAPTSGTPFVLVKDDGSGTQLDVYVDSGYQFHNIPTTPGDCLVLVLSFEPTGGGSPPNGKWNLLVNGVAQAEYTGTIGMFQVFATHAYMMSGFGGVQNGDVCEARFYDENAVVTTIGALASDLSAYLVAKWGSL